MHYSLRYKFEKDEPARAPFESAGDFDCLIADRKTVRGLPVYDLLWLDDYNLEFLEENVQEANIKKRPRGKRAAWYLGKQWLYQGDKEVPRGVLEASELGTGDRVNQFKCKRKDNKAKAGKEYVWFTVPFVIHRYEEKTPH